MDTPNFSSKEYQEAYNYLWIMFSRILFEEKGYVVSDLELDDIREIACMTLGLALTQQASPQFTEQTKIALRAAIEIHKGKRQKPQIEEALITDGEN